MKTSMRHLGAGALSILLLACGGGGGNQNNNASGIDYADPVARQARLQLTLEELAAFGEKRAGTAAGHQAGDYVRDRFVAAGLQDVAFESFTIPSFELESSSLTLTAAGTALAMAHEVFAFSGTGAVDATVVFVGRGGPEDYAGVDATGLVVLVERSSTYHRSSQYREAVAHGGVAMLYISAAPDNLIQVGVVTDPEDGAGPIPAITVGADDGQRILDALDASQEVRMQADVQAEVILAEARNVVGWLYGLDPTGAYFLVGGHYDTWFTGSADNSTGVAATLELAEALVANGGPPERGICFVGYDAEEPGLFGGYDFLRRHVVVGGEPLLAFLNFEMPANNPDGLRALGSTSGAGLPAAVIDSGLTSLYIISGGLEMVPGLFGGIIPTDIQGLYWYGIQGVTTASDTPYYHTTQDTPERIDMPFFTNAMGAFLVLMEALDEIPPETFGVRDDHLWQADVQLLPGPGDREVTVTVTDAGNVIQPDAMVRIWVNVDDFTRSHLAQGVTDGAGQATFVIPAAAIAAGTGAGDSWLHVWAGETFPLVEQILPLP